MCTYKQPIYLLVELPNIAESVYEPLKTSQRIKYTCFDVSKNLIVFGATSGGIYVFNRDPCEFVQLIPNKDGTITRLAISPNEKHIAFANSRGIVTVSQCEPNVNQSLRGLTSKEHQGNEVTSLVWGGASDVYSGDDTGKVSVLVMPNFLKTTIFQSGSQIIMHLDSRIIQLDTIDAMLLVSTLSRCYICDTSQEQYRQIGQKLRDGEFGACFVTDDCGLECTSHGVRESLEVNKYSIVNGDTTFGTSDKLLNTKIYCARPSSRLWEANIEGTVKQTHQFKQILSTNPSKIITKNCLDDNFDIYQKHVEGKSSNFPKIFNIKNHVLFSFKRNALYFLNLNKVDHTIWSDVYSDIIDCKLYDDVIYVWRQDGSLDTLKFMKIDNYLLKCYFDMKYQDCLIFCKKYREYLVNTELSSSLHILSGLKSHNGLNADIEDVIQKFEGLKEQEATITKSGIYVVDNSYVAKTSLNGQDLKTQLNSDDITRLIDDKITSLKDISTTVTGKLNNGKRLIKETWVDIEEKLKNLNVEKVQYECDPPIRLIDTDILDVKLYDDIDIIFKQTGQVEILTEPAQDEDFKCKSLYQIYMLSLIEHNESNLVKLIDSFTISIKEVHELMIELKAYCVKIQAFDQSKYVPNNMFLSYVNSCTKTDEILDEVIDDKELYKYFVDSCLVVNKNLKCNEMVCDCGFPLPSKYDTPKYAKLIDKFIEKQWLKQSKDECYSICKKMPYLWRNLLYLQRNDQLNDLLNLLLQILDENILNSFLPNFTIDTWNKTIELYATLQTNKCLNCAKSFTNITVNNLMTWDDICLLMLKSIGGKNSLKIMEKHSNKLCKGDLSIRFYHCCIYLEMFEKIEKTSRCQLLDCLYESCEYSEAMYELCNALRETKNGELKNTSLPIIVAANTNHWGMTKVREKIKKKEKINMADLCSFFESTNHDCLLCGLPCSSEVLIQDGGLFTFKCGHVFHGSCLDLNKVKLCSSCV